MVSYCISDDLNIKLLINQTNTPFVTSYNPLVEYNQFLEERPVLGPTRGYAALGIQLFLPLDAKKMIQFYDGLNYKVGDKKRDHIVLTDFKTVDQLNLLQILNADRMIYGNNQLTERYLNQLYRLSQEYQRPFKPISNVSPIYFSDDPKKRPNDVIHMRSTEAKIKLQIEGITLTKRAKQHVFSNMAVQIRPKILARLPTRSG